MSRDADTETSESVGYNAEGCKDIGMARVPITRHDHEAAAGNEEDHVDMDCEKCQQDLV